MEEKVVTLNADDVRSTEPPFPRRPILYNLRAVVHHFGMSTHHGHYITDARGVVSPGPLEGLPVELRAGMTGDSEWRRHNDERVTLTTWDDVSSLASQKSAYLLFFVLQEDEA